MAEDAARQWLPPIKLEENARRGRDPLILPVLEPRVSQNKHRTCGKCCRILGVGEYCPGTVSCCHCCGCRRHGTCSLASELRATHKADCVAATASARRYDYYLASYPQRQPGARVGPVAEDGRAKDLVPTDTSRYVGPLGPLAMQTSSTEASSSSQTPVAQQWGPSRSSGDVSSSADPTDRKMSLVSEDLAVSFRRRFEGGYTLSSESYPTPWPPIEMIDRNTGPGCFTVQDHDGRNVRRSSLAEGSRQWPLTEREYTRGSPYTSCFRDDHPEEPRNVYASESADACGFSRGISSFDLRANSQPEAAPSTSTGPRTDFDSWASAGWRTAEWSSPDSQPRSSTKRGSGGPPTPPQLPLLDDKTGNGIAAAAEGQGQKPEPEPQVEHPPTTYAYLSPLGFYTV